MGLWDKITGSDIAVGTLSELGRGLEEGRKKTEDLIENATTLMLSQGMEMHNQLRQESERAKQQMRMAVEVFGLTDAASVKTLGGLPADVFQEVENSFKTAMDRDPTQSPYEIFGMEPPAGVDPFDFTNEWIFSTAQDLTGRIANIPNSFETQEEEDGIGQALANALTTLSGTRNPDYIRKRAIQQAATQIPGRQYTTAQFTKLLEMDVSKPPHDPVPFSISPPLSQEELTDLTAAKLANLPLSEDRAMDSDRVIRNGDEYTLLADWLKIEGNDIDNLGKPGSNENELYYRVNKNVPPIPAARMVGDEEIPTTHSNLLKHAEDYAKGLGDEDDATTPRKYIHTPETPTQLKRVGQDFLLMVSDVSEIVKYSKLTQEVNINTEETVLAEEIIKARNDYEEVFFRLSNPSPTEDPGELPRDERRTKHFLAGRFFWDRLVFDIVNAAMQDDAGWSANQTFEDDEDRFTKLVEGLTGTSITADTVRKGAVSPLLFKKLQNWARGEGDFKSVEGDPPKTSIPSTWNAFTEVTRATIIQDNLELGRNTLPSMYGAEEDERISPYQYLFPETGTGVVKINNEGKIINENEVMEAINTNSNILTMGDVEKIIATANKQLIDRLIKERFISREDLDSQEAIVTPEAINLVDAFYKIQVSMEEPLKLLAAGGDETNIVRKCWNTDVVTALKEQGLGLDNIPSGADLMKWAEETKAKGERIPTNPREFIQEFNAWFIEQYKEPNNNELENRQTITNMKKPTSEVAKVFLNVLKNVGDFLTLSAEEKAIQEEALVEIPKLADTLMQSPLEEGAIPYIDTLKALIENDPDKYTRMQIEKMIRQVILPLAVDQWRDNNPDKLEIYGAAGRQLKSITEAKVISQYLYNVHIDNMSPEKALQDALNTLTENRGG